MHQDFFAQVISRMHDDDIGKLAKKEPNIIAIGRNMFSAWKRKENKLMELRHSTSYAMRMLARLLLCFREKQAGAALSDLFDRKNFSDLEYSIEKVSSSETGLKYATKAKIHPLLMNAANTLKAIYRMEMDDEMASKMGFFLEVLNLRKNDIFGDAAYGIMKKRHEHLRMPEQLLSDDDYNTMKNCLTKKISHLTSKMTFDYSGGDLTTFVALRDTLCARVTLFNARRGNEVSSLTIPQFENALQSRYTLTDNEDRLNMSKTEKEVMEGHMLTYMDGKGNKSVPVIFPNECIPGLKLLGDRERRKNVGVSETNSFVFANTGKSEDHVTGWACTNKHCEEAGLEKSVLNPTKQRHRVSTKFAALERSDQRKDLFYSHMGHCAEVNKSTYQHPLALMELTQVGQDLRMFDAGMFT